MDRPGWMTRIALLLMVLASSPLASPASAAGRSIRVSHPASTRLLLHRSPLPSAHALRLLSWHTDQTSGCPNGWSCDDINGSTPAGSQSLSSGTWTIIGGGGAAILVGGSSDQFHFVSQSLPASGVVSARVLSETTPSLNIQAGVMMRGGNYGATYLDGAAPYYYVGVTGQWPTGSPTKVIWQYRRGRGLVSQGGQVTSSNLPISVMVVRSGISYTGYTSTDGQTWTPIPGSTVPISMPGSVQAGLAVASNSSSATNTATFDSVSILPQDQTPITPCPRDWDCTDVGGPFSQPDGEATVNETSWAIDGWGHGTQWSGQSLGPPDQFCYVSQPFGGGVITGRMFYEYDEAPPAPYGGAGLMVRQDTSGQAYYYAVGYGTLSTSMCSCAGLRIEWRAPDPNTGQPVLGATYLTGFSLPLHLAIGDAGGAFTAYTSSDGSTWTPVNGSQKSFTGWTGTGRAGMYVGGATDVGKLATAGFDHVRIISGTPTRNELCSSVVADTTDSQADPVTCADGSFSHDFQDLSIPGRGLSLDLTRTYRSTIASQDSPFGFGWASNDAMYLSMDSSSDVLVHQPNGAIVTFYAQSTLPGGGSGYVAAGHVLATLVDNGNGTMTVSTKDHAQYTFVTPTQTATGQLQSEKDGNGYTTTFSYDGSGRLSGITDPENRSLTFAYGDSRPANVNHVTSVTDPGTRQVSFAYDASGNLTDAYELPRADASSVHWVFTYDPNHLLLSMQDPDGHLVTNVYDSQQRVHTQTQTLSGGNRTYQFDYSTNADGTNQTKITDPAGHVTLDTFDSNLLISQTLGSGTPQAATWAYSYDPVTDEKSSVTDPNGHTWQYQWDSKANLTQVIGPASTNSVTNHETTSITYTPTNSFTYTQAVITDPTGVATTVTYDAAGNLLSVSRPLTGTNQTATTSYSYDPNHPGDLVQIQEPNGNTTTFGYDANGLPTTETDGANDSSTSSQTSYGYDSLGRLTSVVSPKGNVPPTNPSLYTSTIAYDTAGDVTTETDPLGNQTAYHYDANGNLTSLLDARQHTTTYSYDQADELTGVTQPDGSSQTYTYDKNGNLLSQSMLNASSTVLRTLSSTYDPLDRVATSTDAMGHQTQYGYDGAGNLTAEQTPMGCSISYGYDELDELTGITYAAAGATCPSTPNVSYSYTSSGLRSTMTDGTGTSRYTYDSLNRLTEAVNGAGSDVKDGYDLSGNLTSITYPDTHQVQRQYDAQDRLTHVVDWLGNNTGFSYDQNGNLTKETYPADTNGTTSSLTYNTADQLQKILVGRSSGANPFHWTFGYGRDPLGQVSVSTDRLPGIRHSYTYDALNRLTQDKRGNKSATSWSYDAADNLTTWNDSGTGLNKTLSYDATNTQLSSLQLSGSQSDTLTYAYNTNGDRTSVTDQGTSTTTSYGYNQVDELTSFSQGNTSASYAYDGDGLRVSKTVNGTSESFTWDLAEGMPVMLQDGSTDYLTGPGGSPIEQVDGSGRVTYFVQDQLGSTRGLIDSSGTVIGTATFDAYGVIKGQTGVTSPFGFAGQYTDAESGLQYLRARYYDPNSAQFITLDPLQDITSEPYGYATGDPLSNFDPAGTCAVNSRSEPTFWGKVRAGKCRAEITGVGYDSEGVPHFSLRIWKGTREFYNYHIYYAEGTPPGLMRWRVDPVIHGRSPRPRSRSYVGEEGRNAEQQSRIAAGEMATEVEYEIRKECGKTNIKKLLMQRDKRYRGGALPTTFYAVYSAKTGLDGVDPFCPHGFGCN